MVGVVALCGGGSWGLCPSSLQNLLLCVLTVVVTTWFSSLCLGEPPTGSGNRESSLWLPLRLPALSATLLAMVTTLTGPRTAHLRHRAPVTTVVGASVPVSIGKTRHRRVWGREGALMGRWRWSPGAATGRLMPPHCPQPLSAVASALWTTDSGSSWMLRCSAMPRRSSSAASRSVLPDTAHAPSWPGCPLVSITAN